MYKLRHIEEKLSVSTGNGMLTIEYANALVALLKQVFDVGAFLLLTYLQSVASELTVQKGNKMLNVVVGSESIERTKHLGPRVSRKALGGVQVVWDDSLPARPTYHGKRNLCQMRRQRTGVHRDE